MAVRALRRALASRPALRLALALRPALLLLASLIVAAGPGTAAEPLAPLARVGPWPAVSQLVGYRGRVWFANSVKFVNHNSADLYSYDPKTGETRYERHLFSQDAGRPAVAGGRLYWPFEDGRFSSGHGEFMVTDGETWDWRVLPEGRVFHVHTMLARDGALYAAASAWRATVQRSDDLGVTWRVLYDHPTARGRVSRITSLGVLGDDLYAGLTAWSEDGIKLLRFEGETFVPVAGWPAGRGTDALTAYRGWLYAVNHGGGTAVWRTDGRRTERVSGLDGRNVRAFAAGPDALWAVSGGGGGGGLWRSGDGVEWSLAQRFETAEPIDVLVHGGAVYVGTIGPADHGALWGPPAGQDAATPPAAPVGRLAPTPGGLDEPELAAAKAALDAALADPQTYGHHFVESLVRLARSGSARAGEILSARLDAPVPEREVELFGGLARVSAAKIARWYLLWAIAQSGHGRVPPALIDEPWGAPPNDAEKYLEAAPGAAWAAARLGQRDPGDPGRADRPPRPRRRSAVARRRPHRRADRPHRRALRLRSRRLAPLVARPGRAPLRAHPGRRRPRSADHPSGGRRTDRRQTFFFPISVGSRKIRVISYKTA